MPFEGKIPAVGQDRPSGRSASLSGICHRLLLSLATAPCGVTVRALAALVDRPQTTTYEHLAGLIEDGLAEPLAPPPLHGGYRLRPGVVVSERGFVGRVVPLGHGPFSRVDLERASCG